MANSRSDKISRDQYSRDKLSHDKMSVHELAPRPLGPCAFSKLHIVALRITSKIFFRPSVKLPMFYMSSFISILSNECRVLNIGRVISKWKLPFLLSLFQFFDIYPISKILKGVPNIYQDAGSCGLIFRPSKKVMTPLENRQKKDMTHSKIRSKKLMTLTENRPKNHDPVGKLVRNSHDPVAKLVGNSYDPVVVKPGEKSHDPAGKPAEKIMQSARPRISVNTGHLLKIENHNTRTTTTR